MKAALIIASQNFRDEELNEPKSILEAGGVTTTIFSTKKGTCRGMFGATATAEKTIEELVVSDYDAILFIGGTGANVYWNNATAHKIAKDAVSQNKVLGAICIAPVTLANAGVLQGKKATVFSTESYALKSKGANYTGEAVTVDGKIVTGSGPQAAKDFGKAILKLLK